MKLDCQEYSMHEGYEEHTRTHISLITEKAEDMPQLLPSSCTEMSGFRATTPPGG
jgi:hypothetical protein